MWTTLVWQTNRQRQRRAHPYQASRAKRCADRRFPRSPATVRGEGMRSWWIRSQQCRQARLAHTPIRGSSISLRPLWRPGLLMLGSSTTGRSSPGPKGWRRPPVSTPENVAAAQRPKPLQRAITTLAGVVLVVNARMGERQRPAPLTGGLLGRLQPGRAT